ncbi:hypothetical protein SanaruYs_00540 [Chryseotalea sanaruensis]|uniref:Uncharacterized protein n=1 Tax=Chryseotalea sanaruensis TaxID=2482724 RepID=A0A401U4S1_9BACT|nr:hypothetical protein [Chryseotalea sanaruensis]GCC49840.1 hypothetical protein SanaruYs_00540 [Chryseotalea sanaruensis]
MRKISICLITAMTISGSAFSQTSLLQDADGKSAFSLATSDSLQLILNAAEKSLSLSFIDQDILSTQNLYWGAELKFSGKDGKIPIIKKGETNFQVQFGLTSTYVGKNAKDFFYISPKINVSRIEIASIEGTLIKKESVAPTNYSIQLGYNTLELIDRKHLRRILLGIAIEIGSMDNVKSIDKYEYRELNLSGLTSTGSSGYVTTEVSEVYLKSQLKQNMQFIRPMVDVGYFIPNARLTPMIHLRQDIYPNKESVDLFSPGAGIYLNQKNNPDLIVLGLQIFYKDWNNNLNKETDRWDRATMNFVVGFKF